MARLSDLSLILRRGPIIRQLSENHRFVSMILRFDTLIKPDESQTIPIPIIPRYTRVKNILLSAEKKISHDNPKPLTRVHITHHTVSSLRSGDLIFEFDI